jgi:soluble lytic murein transglycosylase-like protein
MRLLALTAALLAVVTPVTADDLVVFTDGRTLRVSGWEPTGQMAVLELEGGGAISVPLARIANVESLPAPPPPVTATSFEGAPWRDRAGDFADAIGKAATRYEIDPALLTAMAEAESAFDPLAVSHKGACGMLQLLPETAERFGVEDIFDVDQNLDGGAQYMRWLLDRFEGRTDLALAAYNAGENAVDRHGGIPPYRETRNYVSRILGSLR